MSARHTPARGASLLVDQPGLFHPASLAATVVIPPAPVLEPHGLCPRQGEERGIEVRYVGHDGGGHHFTYQATSGTP